MQPCRQQPQAHHGKTQSCLSLRADSSTLTYSGTLITAPSEVDLTTAYTTSRLGHRAFLGFFSTPPATVSTLGLVLLADTSLAVRARG